MEARFLLLYGSVRCGFFSYRACCGIILSVDSSANAAFNLASGSKQEVPFMDSFVFFEMRIKVLFVASALPLALGLVRGNKTIDDVLSYISTILHYLLHLYFLLLLDHQRTLHLDHQRTLHLKRAKEQKAGSKMNKIKDRLNSHHYRAINIFFYGRSYSTLLLNHLAKHLQLT